MKRKDEQDSSLETDDEQQVRGMKFLGSKEGKIQ